MTHSTYAESVYFGEIRKSRAELRQEESERNIAANQAAKEVDAVEIYRQAYRAASGDADDRSNAGYAAIAAVYPKDALDLYEIAWPVIESETPEIRMAAE